MTTLVELTQSSPERQWLALLTQARPQNRTQTYLLFDVHWSDVGTHFSAQLRQHLRNLLSLAMQLRRQAIHLALFLPDLLRAELTPYITSGLRTETIEWKVQDLQRLLETRLQQAGGVGDCAELFTAPSRPKQLAEQLVQAAKGSPRNLLTLGNLMIDVNVEELGASGEFTVVELERAIAQFDVSASMPIDSVDLEETTMPQRTAVKVFFSYSHKDEKLRDQLAQHLSILERQGIIASWHDRRISAGQEWKQQIDEQISESQIILLLISANFIASDYCWDIEVQRAMERHAAGDARVIPIILRSVNWHHAPFAKLQALPTDAKPVTSWSNRDKAFLNISQGIERVIKEF